MNRRLVVRLAVAIGSIAILAVVGVYGYNLGVARGLAEAGRIAAAPGAPPAAYYPYPYFHMFPLFFFPFFPLFPLFFLLFWLFIARAIFWRGGWRGCRGEARPDRG